MRKTIYILLLCILVFPPILLQAQWTKTNGLPGGSTTQFFNYGDTVLATIGTELYFSVNHGKAWSPVVCPDFNSIRVFAS